MPASDDSVEQNAKKIVKTFSWKTYARDPDNDLAKSLVSIEACNESNTTNEATLREQWIKLFDPSIEKALQ